MSLWSSSCVACFNASLAGSAPGSTHYPAFGTALWLSRGRVCLGAGAARGGGKLCGLQICPPVGTPLAARLPMLTPPRPRLLPPSTVGDDWLACFAAAAVAAATILAPAVAAAAVAAAAAAAAAAATAAAAVAVVAVPIAAGVSRRVPPAPASLAVAFWPCVLPLLRPSSAPAVGAKAPLLQNAFSRALFASPFAPPPLPPGELLSTLPVARTFAAPRLASFVL